MENYKTNASYDAKNWFRLQNTEYKNGKLYFNSPAEVQGQITTEPYGE